MLFNTNPILAKIFKKLKLDLDYIYNEQFATSILRDKQWVSIFAKHIITMFNPKSIIDFGCGTGDIIAPYEKMGLLITGIDGSKANYKHKKIKSKNFVVFDLRNKYTSKIKYDLCFCLEVAEHIEEKFIDTLIENLTDSSNTIIFSAAAVDQIGHDHVTLKPTAWWVQKFKNNGFTINKKLTNKIKKVMSKIDGVQFYYINNTQIFQKN